MSSLNDKVYEFVKNIPRGKVATYGQIALHLGNRNFARVVGNILHNNPDPEHIPCHRVVNVKGQLSRSYAFGGIDAQRHLLESEGVMFKNDQVVDLSYSKQQMQASFLKNVLFISQMSQCGVLGLFLQINGRFVLICAKILEDLFFFDQRTRFFKHI